MVPSLWEGLGEGAKTWFPSLWEGLGEGAKLDAHKPSNSPKREREKDFKVYATYGRPREYLLTENAGRNSK